MKYSEEQIKEICKKNDIYFHHFDQFEKPLYLNDENLKRAIVVVYSSSFGHWSLAINEDGTVIFPYSKELELIEELKNNILNIKFDER
jgi:hypothetical protein